MSAPITARTGEAIRDYIHARVEETRQRRKLSTASDTESGSRQISLEISAALVAEAKPWLHLDSRDDGNIRELFLIVGGYGMRCTASYSIDDDAVTLTCGRWSQRYIVPPVEVEPGSVLDGAYQLFAQRGVDRQIAYEQACAVVARHHTATPAS